jgi:predicted negative regulator of RcsB-dependent stress response
MGFVYATIGVIYGVILGFVVITVWQEFEDATAQTDQEALTVANLIRLTNT